MQILIETKIFFGKLILNLSTFMFLILLVLIKLKIFTLRDESSFEMSFELPYLKKTLILQIYTVKVTKFSPLKY